MLNKIVIAAAFISSSAAFAASSNNTVVISDNENVTIVADAGKNWAIAATSQINGLVKMREFYDMGALGVQQIDYVVNCADQKLSLAGFTVLPTTVAQSEKPNDRTYADLSFYTPVIQHDKNILNNVCGGNFVVRNAQANN
jgi:hypothetical protein